ncbi:MAG: hypothetical protein AAB069_03710, partial [Planctomycetota bacterium]
ALSCLSFEIVSYFDIRISHLVAARGRARKSVSLKCFIGSRPCLVCFSGNSIVTKNDVFRTS